jgi:hypothetical protein
MGRRSFSARWPEREHTVKGRFTPYCIYLGVLSNDNCLSTLLVYSTFAKRHIDFVCQATALAGGLYDAGALDS